MEKVLKKIKIICIIVMVICVSVFTAWKMIPVDAKLELIKSLSKREIVRNIVAEEVQSDYEKNILDAEFDDQDIAVGEQIRQKLSGFKNVVLFGIDARDSSFDNATRSDTIMIISINNETGAIRIVSLYRDTFLKIIGKDGDTYYSKVNAAYSEGGAKSALSTLNTNLDLNISDYVVVNFYGLSEIIDMLGGIEIIISDLEMSRINKISTDMIEGTDIEYVPLEESGEVHLDGLQATAFCRIRDAEFYDESGNKYEYDFGRTARQRYVMQKLVSKAKGSGISTLLSLVKQIMNMNTEEEIFLKSSLDYNEIMDLGPVLVDYNIERSTGFPFTLATPNIDGTDLVVAQGLTYNVSELHRFLFDDEEYQPSDSVRKTDDYIKTYTKIPEKHK